MLRCGNVPNVPACINGVAVRWDSLYFLWNILCYLINTPFIRSDFGGPIVAGSTFGDHNFCNILQLLFIQFEAVRRCGLINGKWT